MSWFNCVNDHDSLSTFGKEKEEEASWGVRWGSKVTKMKILFKVLLNCQTYEADLEDIRTDIRVSFKS